jgi:hypothetical protein
MVASGENEEVPRFEPWQEWPVDPTPKKPTKIKPKKGTATAIAPEPAAPISVSAPPPEPAPSPAVIELAPIRTTTWPQKVLKVAGAGARNLGAGAVDLLRETVRDGVKLTVLGTLGVGGTGVGVYRLVDWLGKPPAIVKGWETTVKGAPGRPSRRGSQENGRLVLPG